jgi:hypothetical protein
MKESLMYGVFGGVIGFLYMGWVCSPKSSHQPSLAIVDMQELVSKKSQQLALKLTGIGINDISLQESAKQLKEDLQTFATANNLVLLAKGTVVSGDVPDKTEEILAMMDKGE